MPGGYPGGGPWHGLGPRFNGMTLWRRKDTIAGRPDRGDSAGMSESPKTPALVGAVDEAAMNATREIVAVRRWPETLRWGGCLALALGIHAAGAAVLLGWGEAPDSVANAPLIMIELAPLPVAPESKPTEIPPGPQQMQAEPESQPEKPIEKVEAPVAPQAELQKLASLRRRSRWKSRTKRSRSKSTPAWPARPARLKTKPRARRRRCRAPLRTIPTRCRTGSRSWSPGSNATSAPRLKRRIAAEQG